MVPKIPCPSGLTTGSPLARNKPNQRLDLRDLPRLRELKRCFIRTGKNRQAARKNSHRRRFRSLTAFGRQAHAERVVCAARGFAMAFFCYTAVCSPDRFPYRDDKLLKVRCPGLPALFRERLQEGASTPRDRSRALHDESPGLGTDTSSARPREPRTMISSAKCLPRKSADRFCRIPPLYPRVSRAVCNTSLRSEGRE